MSSSISAGGVVFAEHQQCERHFLVVYLFAACSAHNDLFCHNSPPSCDVCLFVVSVRLADSLSFQYASTTQTESREFVKSTAPTGPPETTGKTRVSAAGLFGCFDRIFVAEFTTAVGMPFSIALSAVCEAKVTIGCFPLAATQSALPPPQPAIPKQACPVLAAPAQLLAAALVQRGQKHREVRSAYQGHPSSSSR